MSDSFRTEILRRPSFFNFFSGILLDWEYFWKRSVAALTEEAYWATLSGLRVAVDFTRSTNLFPGLRLCDDIHGYYQDSMARIHDVLFNKLVLFNASNPELHAIFTLHATSEIPPTNFSSNPQAQTAASVLQTLSDISGHALSLGVNMKLHLRRSSRNDRLSGPSINQNLQFVQRVNQSNFHLAPSLPYVASRGDSITDISSMVALFFIHIYIYIVFTFEFN